MPLKVTLLALLAMAGCAAQPRVVADDPVARIAVLSDLNSSYGSTEYDAEVRAGVALVIEQWRPDLVLIAGDMIAGQRPSLTDANVRAMWAAFDETVAQPLRQAGIPLAFTLGNHDASGHPAHGRDRRLAAEYWRDPAHRPAYHFDDDARFPFNYAFTTGGVFVLVLNASTGNVAADSAQLAWVRRMLSGEAARRAHARIALGHVPLYAVAEGRNSVGEVQAEPDSLRRLLQRGNVDMYVAGHHHAYYPGRRDDLLLLSTGALGQGPRPLIGTDITPFKSITLLEVQANGAITDHTFRIDGATLVPVDLRHLPQRIDGINGYVVRRDASDGG